MRGAAAPFPQQFDPFTGQLCGPDGYGPTILAVLEYITKLYGVDLDEETLVWSGLPRGEHTLEYTWQWRGNTYMIHNEKGVVRGSINGAEKFSCGTGVRIVTDLQGDVRAVIGLDTKAREVTLRAGGRKYALAVKPNQVWRRPAKGRKFTLASAAPFDYPFQPPAPAPAIK